MIQVTIVNQPSPDVEAKLLSMIVINNVAAGQPKTDTTYEYVVREMRPGDGEPRLRQGIVEHFDRTKKSVTELVHRVLLAEFGPA